MIHHCYFLCTWNLFHLNSEPAETDCYKKEKASASADWKTIIVSTLFIMPWFLSTTFVDIFHQMYHWYLNIGRVLWLNWVASPGLCFRRARTTNVYRYAVHYSNWTNHQINKIKLELSCSTWVKELLKRLQLRNVVESEDDVPYGYWFFHFVFAMGSMYFGMLFIGWDTHHIMEK